MPSHDDIKTILQQHLLGDETLDPVALAEAFDQVAADPALQQWWEQEQAQDDLVRHAMQSAQVPPDLRATLLALESEKKVIAFPRWRTWTTMAAAACLTIGAVLVGFRDTIIDNQLLGHHPQWSGMEAQTDYRDAMAFYIANSIVKLDYTSTDLADVTAWLRGEQLPMYGEISPALAAQDTLGCKEIPWRDATVTLICFHNPDGGIVHLFVMPKAEAPAGGINALEEHRRAFALNSVGWEDSENVYLLVGSEPAVEVEPFMLNKA